MPRFLQVDLATQEKELFEPHSVAPWFSADVKLGCLAIHLELPSCFAAGKLLPSLKNFEVAMQLLYLRYNCLVPLSL